MHVFATLQQILDSIPYPTAVGCLGIGLGFVVAGLASPLKSRADRARKARRPDNRAPAKKLRIQFFLTLLFGAWLTAGGTWLTHNGSRLDAEQMKKDNERDRRELDAKIQNILVALNAAKAEENRLLTEEKIKGFSKDVLQWADDFERRKPDTQRELQQERLAATQQEIQISGDSTQLFSFVLQFIQRTLEAYQKKTGETFKVSLPAIPQNFYDPQINNPTRTIQFTGDAQWQFSVNAYPPAQEQNQPMLYINFRSSDGRNGQLWIRRSPDGKKFNAGGSGSLPVPNAANFFGDYEMTDYEERLSTVLRRLIEGQLSQPATPTPSPTVSP